MTVPAVQVISEAVENKIGVNAKPAASTIWSWCGAHWRKILSEFVSTAMLLLLGCMGCIPLEGFGTNISPALGFGLVVMFNIQIFGHISGAFMNPVVTVASVIWGSTSIPLGIIYIIVQCAGAIVGYGILTAIVALDFAESAMCITRPLSFQDPLQSIGVEMALTAALILINCAVWDPVNKDKQDSAPIKFGLTIIGLSIIGGPLTGASMNPARSLAPAVWTGIWEDQWIYWVGPFLGTLITILPYKYVFLQKKQD